MTSTLSPPRTAMKSRRPGCTTSTVQRGTTLSTLTYDDAGNLVVDNANGNRVTYQYDPENRLVSMHNYTGSRYTYAYWADGLRRYAQEPSSPIVTQIWDGQDLLMEKSPTGTARYIAHEGEVFGEKRGDTRYLYLPDPLGSVVALVDNAQSITDSFIYLPYGEEQSRTGSTASNLRWLGRWGYRRDYTNRAYVRARSMRTDYGQWMSEDPIGFDAGDVNLYRYVAGNPMTGVDPSGEVPARRSPPQVGPPWPGVPPVMCGNHLWPGGVPTCLGCAVVMFNEWRETPQHYCRHDYTHCMACCVLTRQWSEACALGAQLSQDLDGNTLKVKIARLIYCGVGVAAALIANMSCHEACNRAYPPDPQRWRGSRACRDWLRANPWEDPAAPLLNPCATGGPT